MRKTRKQLYDELLVLRSLEGDRQALGELVTRWHPRLRRHAYCLIGNREAAEDVVQETWMAIVKGLSRLDAAGLRWLGVPDRSEQVRCLGSPTG